MIISFSHSKRDVQLTVNTFVSSSFRLHLLRRKKETSSKKAGGEALESLEAQLRDRAKTLGLSLEQRSKAMKQRDKKVSFHNRILLLPAVFYCSNSPSYVC